MKFIQLTRIDDNVLIAIDKIAAIYFPKGHEKKTINSLIVLIDDNTHGIEVCETVEEIKKLIQDTNRNT
jgi:hypothetical protein